MSPAISNAFSAISRALSSVFSNSARAAALGVRAAGADSNKIVFWLHHVTVTGDDKRCSFIRDCQQCFKFAQHAIGTPVFCQLNGGFDQMALMHFQFTFKQFEQRKSIRSTARKARDDFVVVQTADLFTLPFITVLPNVA